MKPVAGTLVVAFGFALVCLAVLIVVRRPLAERFLRSFASSARAHYGEQAGRLLAGVGVVLFAPHMWHPQLFRAFGWLMVVTAVALFLVPWRWHHRFGSWAIPLALRYLKLYALGAFGLGVFILYGASRAILP